MSRYFELLAYVKELIKRMQARNGPGDYDRYNPDSWCTEECEDFLTQYADAYGVQWGG